VHNRGNWTTRCHTDLVPDEHTNPRVNVRAPRTEQEAAEAELKERDWSMQQLVQAVLLAVAEKPDEVLVLLSPYYRPKSRGGRPKKQP
jgi:hypothetical protein